MDWRAAPGCPLLDLGRPDASRGSDVATRTYAADVIASVRWQVAVDSGLRQPRGSASRSFIVAACAWVTPGVDAASAR
jgi:hypothetical protein